VNEVAAQPRRHYRLVKVLVPIASLLTVIAILAAWVERQALDTNEWVDTSGKLIQNDTIRNSIATFAVDQLYANVNVDAELQQKLPKDFKPLAGPAASGLRQLADTAAQQILQSSRFQDLWKNANRAAHETLIKVVEDKGQYASTGNGTVTLHLRPLITDVANQLGLSGSLVSKIPPDVGDLTVLRSDQLSTAQTAVKAIRGLALITSILALVLFALAIYFARGYRWIAILASGIGLILAGVVVLIMQSVSGGLVTDQLATTAAARDPVAAAWPIATSLLAEIARDVIVIGVFFVIAAWLGSPHRSSVATRRAITPILRDYPAFVFTIAGVIALIYVLSGADSTRRTLVHLFIAALAIVGLILLRRDSMKEFPDADMGDTWNRFRARASAMRERHPLPHPPSASNPETERLEALERLGGLHERGILSDEEFEKEKTAVLSRRD
jgi:predicted anti-sigma-YlaC factor YlaD